MIFENMKNFVQKIFLILLLLEISLSVIANNLKITNVSTTQQNSIDNYCYVVFDVEWDNSWKDALNHDAIWVFIKYNDGNGVWNHANISTQKNDHYIGIINNVDPQMVPATDKTGLFIERTENGNGNIKWSQVSIRWNYGENGVTDLSQVKLYVGAIEMVYISEGSFKLGSGGSEQGSFTDGSWTSGASIPYIVNGEDPIEISQVSGKLWGVSSTGEGRIGSEGTLEYLYPKGYNAFYCMKYEISQSMYGDFLNLLTRIQQSNRWTITPGKWTSNFSVSNLPIERNGLKCYSDPGEPFPFIYVNDLNGNNIGNEITDGSDIPCPLTWADGFAFADWAGLRPMSELEYEKICRGDQAPVPNEFAWGNASICTNNYLLNTNAGAYDVSITNLCSGANGNCTYDNAGSTSSVQRVGIFAGNSGNRVGAGATLYGVMEMTGNLLERVITLSNDGLVDHGRKFDGSHGNGDLDNFGFANVPNWINEVGSEGVTFRGGSWKSPVNQLPVSYRSGFKSLGFPDRYSHYGFRCVRSKP